MRPSTPMAQAPSSWSAARPTARRSTSALPATGARSKAICSRWSTLPIKSDATRTAALVSGEIDFVLDPSPRDIERLAASPNVKVIEGPENRIIFLGIDQGRDELLYSNVKGKNPFKDVRVRRALYQAIDIETIKDKLMNGQSSPTGAMVPSPQGSFNDPEPSRPASPIDLAAAKKLLAEAGYANGFEFTIDCPNNRYVNDERICITLASQWAKLGLKVPGQRAAQGDRLQQAREARHLGLSVRLGRLHHRCRQHLQHPLPQPR